MTQISKNNLQLELEYAFSVAANPLFQGNLFHVHDSVQAALKDATGLHEVYQVCAHYHTYAPASSVHNKNKLGEFLQQEFLVSPAIAQDMIKLNDFYLVRDKYQSDRLAIKIEGNPQRDLPLERRRALKPLMDFMTGVAGVGLQQAKLLVNNYAISVDEAINEKLGVSAPQPS